MNQQEIAFLNIQRQVFQPFFLRFVKACCRPLSGGYAIRVKPCKIQLSCHSAVMITGHADRIVTPDDIDALSGLRSIAGNIAEAPQFIYSSPVFSVFQDSLQGSQVTVYVRDDNYSHIGNYSSNTSSFSISRRFSPGKYK